MTARALSFGAPLSSSPRMTTTAPLPLQPGPNVRYPLFRDGCEAGFPSPASDYVEAELSLNELVGAGQPQTYFVRATGRSEVGAGIWPGDLLVIDAAREPGPGDLVVAFVEGEHTVKRFCRDRNGVYLAPDPLPDEAHAFGEIRFGDGEELVVCGVVTHTIRTFLRS